MQAAPLTRSRSSVLGKRPHHSEPTTSPPSSKTEQLQTPDSTPHAKRVRTSLTLVDGDSNKENVPPFVGDVVNVESSPSAGRTLRGLGRSSTELITTPSRSRAGTLRRTSIAAFPVTPTNEIYSLAIATPPPSPPKLLLPIHARARALLRATCNNDSTPIAGRDEERANITTFVNAFVHGPAIDERFALYISGSPGTGKTALVNSILRSIAPEVKVVNINCMALQNVDALWERLLEGFQADTKPKSSTRSKKSSARDLLEPLLSSSDGRCIVLLDELDHIAPNSQALTSLFSIPAKLPEKVRVIGIANTHTLTSSGTLGDSPSVHVETIHFAPYTPTQLQQILQARLASLSTRPDGPVDAELKKFLPPPTLMLLTKKIAALTGDVRSLFEVLRGAIDLAVSAVSMVGPEENPLNSPTPSVTPKHILAALKAYAPSSAKAPSVVVCPLRNASNSETVTKIRNLGLQARLVLLSVMIASKRLDAGLILSASTSTPKKQPTSPIKRTSSMGPARINTGIETSQLHSFYTTLLTRQDAGVFEPVSRSEFCDLVNVLEGTGLLASASTAVSATSVKSTPSKRRAFGRSASFGGNKALANDASTGEIRLASGVWSEEVLRGLGVSEESIDVADVREEELADIWEREKVRMNRELKNLARASTAKDVVGFEDARED